MGGGGGGGGGVSLPSPPLSSPHPCILCTIVAVTYAPGKVGVVTMLKHCSFHSMHISHSTLECIEECIEVLYSMGLQINCHQMLYV